MAGVRTAVEFAHPHLEIVHALRVFEVGEAGLGVGQEPEAPAQLAERLAEGPAAGFR